MSQNSSEDLERTVTVGRVTSEAGSAENLEGKTFAQKYEILELLGEGGMSVVYRARHTGMDKVLAIKVLHSHLVKDELSLRRFKQEAQAASTLSHQAIVAIHDCDETPEGTPYLVMDFVQGVCLADLLKSAGPLKIDEFLQIMQQVASGLAHAHHAGIIHRDLKPSNIMICGSEGQRQAKIVDFGIAKVISNEAAQQLTQTGEVFGSPLYMSPEQCTGAQIDQRADIYSLACVMFEALCGKAPFKGETVFETINKHINEAPPPLDSAQVPDPIKGRVELLLLKCLAKNPADRYSSMDEIESELRALSLKSRAGFLSSIGGAWDLASAKRRASRKSKLPLMVITLMTTSCLSAASVLLLLGGTKAANYEISRLERSRHLLSEITLLQTDFMVLAESARLYFTAMFVKPEKLDLALAKLERTEINTREQLEKVEAALSENPKLLKKFKSDMKPVLLEIPVTAIRKLKELSRSAEQGMMNPQQLTLSVYLGNLCSKGNAKVRELAEEARSIESEQLGRFKDTEKWVSGLALLCAGLNAAVMVALLAYFGKGTPQKLKKLAEQASHLSRRRKLMQSSPNNDLEDLENVMQELATALSDAEEREKLLLEKLMETERKSSI